MEIAPIPGIRSLPSAKAPRVGLRPSEIFDLEGLTRPGDGQEHRQERKAAGAEEDEDDLLLDAESSEEQEQSSRQIDYFA